MNKLIVRSLGSILLALIVSAGVFAQDVKKEEKKALKEVKEENQVKILIQKEGEAVLDTIFSVDGNLDKEFVNKLVKKYSGDQVKVNVFSSKEDMSDELGKKETSSYVFVKSAGEGGKKMKVYFNEDHDKDCDEECEKECEHEVEIDVKVEGDMVYVTTTGEEGEHIINIKEILGDKHSKDAKVMIVKKSGDGDTEMFDILLDDEKLHKKHNVKVIKKSDDITWIDEKDGHVTVDIKGVHGDGDVMFYSTDGKNIHEKHGVKVMKKGDANFWVGDKDSNVVVEGIEAKGNVMFIEGDKVDFTKKGDFSFFEKAPKARKRAITLDQIEGDLYKLELNTNDLDPLVVEVFNSSGDRLYKKKVKNYYGRFLQEIELEGNESAFFTVKVTQGEKELIGEFEF